MTLAYFCLSALALMPGSAVSSASTVSPNESAIAVLLKPKQRQGFQDWIWRQQSPDGGFRGGDSLEGVTFWGSQTDLADSQSIPFATQDDEDDFNRLMDYPDSDSDDLAETPASHFNPPNLIQTYTALLLLALLSSPLTHLDRPGLLRFVAQCQNREDGSFRQWPGCREAPDVRSTYAAFVLCDMLDGWDSIDLEKARAFLRRCHRPEGGYATRPNLEAQGGATYCALASFHLSSTPPCSIPSPDSTLRWLVGQQLEPPSPSPDSETDDDDGEGTAQSPIDWSPRAGFAGRAGKATDACYSFWCTASLALLQGREAKMWDSELDRAWLLSCQHPTFGGIAREPGALPDVYHTYLSLAALSIGENENREEEEQEKNGKLLSLDPAWNVEKGVKERFREMLKAVNR